EFNSYKKLEMGKRLNNYGTASITLPINDSKASSLVALRRNTVWIYRGSDNLWSGEMALRKGELDSKGGGLITIHCFDWLEQLRNRYTEKDLRYDQIDQGEIAWDLVDRSQLQTNGDFRFTRGVITPTKLRDREYHSQQLLEILINLSKVIEGFDFEISNARMFNVYPQIGIYRGATVKLKHGQNMHATSILEDFTNPVNRAIVQGQPIIEDPEILRVERNALTEQGIYKLREDLYSDLDISEEETFEEKGDALLQKYKQALIQIEIDIMPTSPKITEFALGDIIPVIIKKGVYDINENYRIFEWKLTYDSDNVEKITLVIGKYTI
ncbi:MAG: phage tail protein, partial [Agathobacter rectalis]